MSTTGVIIPVAFDLSALQTLGQSVQNAAKRAADALGPALDKGVSKPLDKVGAKLATVGAQIGKTKEGLEKFGSIPGVAIASRAVGMLGGAVGLLANPVGLAVAGFAALTSVVTVGTGAFLAAGVGVVGLVAGSAKLEAAAKSLKQVGLGISDDDAWRLRDARTSLDVLGAVAARFGLSVANDVAPYVERGAILLTALGLAGVQAFDKAGGAVTLFKGVFVGTVDAVLRQANPMLAAFEGITKGLAAVARATGQVELATRLDNAASGVADLASALTDKLQGAATGGLRQLEDYTGGYLNISEALIASLSEQEKAANALHDQVAANAKDMTAFYAGFTNEFIADLHAQNAELAKQKAAQIQTQTDIAKAAVASQAAIADSQRKFDAELLARKQAIAEAIKRGQVAEFTGALDTIGGIAEGATSLLAIAGEGTRKQQKAAWKATQALTVASTLANGAAAAIRAFVDLGPVGGAIASASIIGPAIVSAIQTIKQQKPQFHAGSARFTNGPDERPATILRGEQVVDQRNSRRLDSPRTMGVTVNLGSSAVGKAVLDVISDPRTGVGRAVQRQAVGLKVAR